MFSAMSSTLVRARAERPSGSSQRRDRAAGAGAQRGPQHGRHASPQPWRNRQVGGSVLVVDDEPAIRLLCAVNLGLAGYHVAEAENGQAALDLVRAQTFDLVLLDVMLPDIGGHEVLKTLTAERPLPVALFSARAGRNDIRSGYELGAVDYIVKPFDPIALADRIADILERVAHGEVDAFRRARIAELGE
jgi:DNA-binding response OmpR family regulator